MTTDKEITRLVRDRDNPQIAHVETRFEQQSLAYKSMLDDIYELFLKKGADYGNPDDHYYNIRQSAIQWNITPTWKGALIRQGDKLARLQNYFKTGTLKNESVEDSLRDNAVYALNALAMYLEEQDKK